MRATLLAVGLLAVLALAGCGEDAPAAGTLATRSAEETTSTPTDDKPTDKSTAEETETADDVPPVPELPAEASEDSEAGAEAFTRYYVDLLSHGFSYKEVDELRTHTLDSCETCLEWADTYAETGKKGGKVVEGDASWQITDLIVVEHQPGESARVGVNVTIGEHTFIESADAEPASRPEAQFIFTFVLSRQEESWVIEQMTQA